MFLGFFKYREFMNLYCAALLNVSCLKLKKYLIPRNANIARETPNSAVIRRMSISSQDFTMVNNLALEIGHFKLGEPEPPSVPIHDAASGSGIKKGRLCAKHSREHAVVEVCRCSECHQDNNVQL